MTNEPLWYAVYTKPHNEKKVAFLLAKKNIEHYCPLNKTMTQAGERKKTVMTPLFKSYIFIRIKDSELEKVKQINGIINLVYWLGKPVAIKNEEIEKIYRFMNDHQTVELEKINININPRPHITGAGMQTDNEKNGIYNPGIKMQLPSLGYTLVAKAVKENVRIMKVNDGLYTQKLMAS